jgi:hypothetical protein
MDPGGRPLGYVRIAPMPGAEEPLPEFPSMPRGRGQLFVGVIYSNPEKSREGARDAKLTWVMGTTAVRPDVVIQAASRVDSFWLDAPAGRGRIEVDSKSWSSVRPIEAEVPERAAIGIPSVPLVPRPDLNVSFELPEGLAQGPIDVDLLQCDRAAGVRGPFPVRLCTDLAAGRGRTDQTMEYRSLKPGLYAIRWSRPPLFDIVTCDLRNGKSLYKQIRIRFLALVGTIRKDGKGIPSTLHWSPDNAGGSIEATTNDEGSYRALLVRPGGYRVTIDASDSPQAERRVFITTDEQIDFEIPANEIQIRVVDSVSRRPIPVARISVVVLRPDSDELERSTSLVTNGDGSALYSPPASGRVSVTVEAEGYLRSAAQVWSITDRQQQKLIEVELRKGDGITFHIVDASGSPSSGAVLAPEGRSIARADASGTAVVGENLPEGYPIIVYNRSGSLKALRSSGEREETVVVEEAGPPAVVRFLTPDGRPLRRWNALFSIDGVRFPGISEQAYWSGSDLNAQADGRLRIHGLPRNGVLTLWPFQRFDLAQTRPLPVLEELVFTLPGEP